MDARKIIETFESRNLIDVDPILSTAGNAGLRMALVDHCREQPNRSFALALTARFIDLRKAQPLKISIEDLMLACYLIGLSNEVEDSLKIWEAKTVDFDTYCGIDIQLLLYAGLTETIAFLEAQTSQEATKALEYTVNCMEDGGLDELDEYHAQKDFWWM